MHIKIHLVHLIYWLKIYIITARVRYYLGELYLTEQKFSSPNIYITLWPISKTICSRMLYPGKVVIQGYIDQKILMMPLLTNEYDIKLVTVKNINKVANSFQLTQARWNTNLLTNS